METIDRFMTEVEAKAEHAYRDAYYTEYMRVYEPGFSEDRQHLEFWSALAHGSGKVARERVLASEPVTERDAA